MRTAAWRPTGALCAVRCALALLLGPPTRRSSRPALLGSTSHRSDHRCAPSTAAPFHLSACREHADLWRLVACGPDDALAFDLARSGRRAACAAPAAQLVLQYSLLVPGAAPPGAPPGSWCARAGSWFDASLVALCHQQQAPPAPCQLTSSPAPACLPSSTQL